MFHVLSAAQIYSHICQLRQASPFVHNITNWVAMNFSANALLACGASPLMAHAPEELEEVANISQSLVINIGTLDRDLVSGMEEAILYAAERRIPIVLDPVGSGATKLRTETAKRFLQSKKISVIRGNASEILSLSDAEAKTKGVDSAHSSHEALRAAQSLVSAHDLVVCVSGEVDFMVGKKSKVW